MKKSELDLLVRNEVRKFLKENYGMAEAPRAAGRQKKAPDAEKETAMHTEDGDTFEEIAEEMGLSAGSMGNTRLRCLEALSKALLSRGVI